MKRLAVLPICLALAAAPAVAGNLDAAVMDPQVIENAVSSSDNGTAVVVTIALLTFLLALIEPAPGLL